MNTVKAGFQYLGAVLVGLSIAGLATGLISYAIFPPDGPIGEGIAMLFIYFLSGCVCVPGYIILMTLHRQARRDTRVLLACEIIFRASAVIGACLFVFMAVKLPTMMLTKWLGCLVGVFACTWAIKPTLWKQSTK